MKTLKRFAILLIVLCLAILLPVMVGAVETSGTCGDSATWMLDETTGALTITGSGAMTDFEAGTAPWNESLTNITSVTIDEGITRIGNNVFCGGTNLVAASLPSTLETIGDSAFKNCSALSTIDIPSGVTSIGKNSFQFCGFVNLEIPDTVTFIDNYGLANCSALEFVKLPKNLEIISECMLYGDRNLTTITMPESLGTIKKNSFSYTGFSSLVIPNSVSVIEDEAFSNCSKLESITLPKNMQKLIGNPIYSCEKLENIFVDEASETLASYDGVLFTKDLSTLLLFPYSKTSFNIPEGTTKIASWAGKPRRALSELTFPSTLKIIDNYAFDSCGFSEIVLPNGLERIGEFAFYNCTRLKDFVIPDSVTFIGEGAFSQCDSLVNMVIPDSVNVGQQFYAFDYCKKLETVVLPSGISSLGYRAFADCPKLRSITIPQGVRTIGAEAFGSFMSQCESLTDIVLPEGVEKIEAGAFACSGLKTITIPETMKQMGAEKASQERQTPFESCLNLTDVYYQSSRKMWSKITGTAINSDGKLTKKVDAVIHFGEADITFDAGDGTGTMDDDIIWKDSAYTLPTCTFTAPDHKQFKEWSIEGAEYSVGAEYTVEDDVTITAVWESIVHTATFVADGTTVGTVNFDEGAASLSEPAVPAKAHYDGAWEQYNLPAAVGDIVINAAYTLNNDHQYDSVVTAPTCTEGGYTTHTCSVCGDVVVDSRTSAAGHSTTTTGAKAPTCTEQGYTGDAVCTVCGETITEGEVIPANGHSTERKNIKAATCTEDGYSGDDICTVCDATIATGSIIPATGHIWDAGVEKAPTCLDGGYTIYTCTVCGATNVQAGAQATGHDYQKNDAKSIVPQPGKDGYDYYECANDPAHYYTVPVFAPIVTHTATFVIGDEVIGVVVFEEGATTIDEQAMPERANYIGSWDSYDLSSAKTDITIYGHYALIDTDKVSDVDSDTEIKYEDSVATFTLNATASSKTIKVISETTKPLDVVLVLDQSGSMADSMTNSPTGKERQSKRDALVSCANSFAQMLYENAVKTGADHRIGVVGFACSAYQKGSQYNPGNGYLNTGLLATAAGGSINYFNLKNSDYQKALLPINNGGAINANVISGINSIVADGATAADLGLRMAKNIFAENPSNGDRERIIIFVTDGTPTSWGTTKSLITQTAAEAISVASDIKNGQGAKIYCVGVTEDANASAAFTSSSDGVQTNSKGELTYDFNRFLHAVSSNYPNAKAMNNLGDGDKASGYYMAVTDTGNLGSIFTNILYSTVYQLKAFDKATFRYTLPREFTLTLEQELAMREELRSAYGITDADISVVRNQDGTTDLTFCNIPSEEAYDNSGALIYKATLSFRATANQNASGSTSGGTGEVLYEGSVMTDLAATVIDVPANRNLLVFTINGEVYQILEAELGDVVTVPDTQLAQWKVDPGTVVNGAYTVFEAVNNTTYTVTWDLNGTIELQHYRSGDSIIQPDATVYAPIDYEFTGWSRTVPATMPAYDITVTALYSPKHVHIYTEAYKKGTCTSGIETVFRCACGDEISEQAAPSEHNLSGVFSDNGSDGTTIEKLVCTECGYSKEQNITYKVAYTERRKTTVLDLTLYESEVNVTVPDEEIEIRFYIGDDGGKTYTITRIDENGKKTSYNAKTENGYLVFKANHFSIYVIGEIDEETQKDTAEDVEYEDAIDILDNKEIPTEPEDSIPDQPTQGSTEKPNTDTTVWYPANQDTTVKQNDEEKDTDPTPVGVTVDQFEDVDESAWYYEYVKFVVENGLFKGTSDTAFEPKSTMTRGMFMTVLARLDGQDTESGEFWYSVGLAWAVENGIPDGTDPDTPITREQLVTMLYRYAGEPEADGDLKAFDDADSVSSWALDAMRWAVSAGIVNGRTVSTLEPTGTATRAEVATMMMRFAEKVTVK